MCEYVNAILFTLTSRQYYNLSGRCFVLFCLIVHSCFIIVICSPKLEFLFCACALDHLTYVVCERCEGMQSCRNFLFFSCGASQRIKLTIYISLRNETLPPCSVSVKQRHWRSTNQTPQRNNIFRTQMLAIIYVWFRHLPGPIISYNNLFSSKSSKKVLILLLCYQ